MNQAATSLVAIERQIGEMTQEVVSNLMTTQIDILYVWSYRAVQY